MPLPRIGGEQAGHRRVALAIARLAGAVLPVDRQVAREARHEADAAAAALACLSDGLPLVRGIQRDVSSGLNGDVLIGNYGAAGHGDVPYRADADVCSRDTRAYRSGADNTDVLLVAGRADRESALEASHETGFFLLDEMRFLA